MGKRRWSMERREEINAPSYLRLPYETSSNHPYHSTDISFSYLDDLILFG
jgi:hypothetical protein